MIKQILRIFLTFGVFIFLFSIQTNNKSFANAQMSSVPGFYCYRNISSIYNRVIQLENDYSELVDVIDIGDSWEKINSNHEYGHDILVLKIENRKTNGSKSSLIIVSGLKANSFGPVEINLRFAEFLLENYQSRDDLQYLLDHFELHFIFLANPDGRQRAESQANGEESPELITWTKNTNPGQCASGDGGVSIERNFSYQWQNLPINPCAINYPGLSPFSEPETQALRDYLQNISQTNPGKPLLIHLESYQDFILNPYLYSKTHKVNQYEAYQILSNKLAYGQEAVPQAYDSDAFQVQYGTLIDYAHEELGMVALQYRLGSQQGGEDVSRCAYFEETLAQPAIDSLLHAFKTLPNPLEYGAGPEIHDINLSFDYENNIAKISGKLDSQSYYRHTNRTTSIYELHYSINLPPWLPEALLISDNPFERDIEFPGLADFELLIDMNEITPEGTFIYLQGVAEDWNRDSYDAGFIERVWIKGLDSSQKLYLPIVTSKP